MTVSRKESEVTILRTIAEADGDLVNIELSQQREILIISDLIEGGYIKGIPLISGGGTYRITSAGEVYLSKLEQELIDEEEGVWSKLIPERQSHWTWKNARWAFGGVVLLGSFVWWMLSQVIAPSAYCSKLPEGIAGILVPCQILEL